MKIFVVLLMGMLISVASVMAQDMFEKDVIETGAGPCEITFIGHGSLMFSVAGQIIHIDPYSRLADYSKLPKADLVLLTHHHGDHLDPVALQKIRKENTVVIGSAKCAESVKDCLAMRNGEKRTIAGIDVFAVPAYNVLHKRDNGEPFHPKGVGNGYIIKLGDKRIYVAGDTENTAEMKALQNIDVAFLPMNLPYTMTPAMVADAALGFRPKVLYPYHYGKSNLSDLIGLLKGTPEIEVRVRKME